MKRKLRRACARALKEIFSMSGFRPGQKAAASALLSGRDLLCILPTGAGKSLCWQLPAVIHEGLTVVVSPLIALMQDQLEHLREKGIPAVSINSLMSHDEQAEATKLLDEGRVRIVFVSPERLEMAAFVKLCRKESPWLLVVDEAHCVVSWGDDFRPAYGNIGAFIHALPHRPVVCAMTATADGRMQQQISESLGMRWPKRVMLPVLRGNLVYSVRTAMNPSKEILHLMQSDPIRTVVFCKTRARTEQLAGILVNSGIAASAYHAGLDRQERLRVQECFREGGILCLAATTAFGMGVDIPDVRRVIHDSLPDTVVDYVQQSGRAGRDGQDAQCVILISPKEMMFRRERLDRLQRPLRRRPLKKARFLQRNWKPMRTMLSISLTQACIPSGIAEAFGQRARPCGRCSACINGPLVSSVPDLARMDAWQLRLWFIQWQLGAMARLTGEDGHRIMSRQQMMDAAMHGIVPDLRSVGETEAMARMIRALWPGSLRAGRKVPAEDGGNG